MIFSLSGPSKWRSQSLAFAASLALLYLPAYQVSADTPSEPTDQTDSNGDDPSDVDDRDDTKFTISIIPIPFLRLDQGRDIINLGPGYECPPKTKGCYGDQQTVQVLDLKKDPYQQNGGKGYQQNHFLNNQTNGEGHVLIEAQPGDRYRVVERRHRAFGLGVAVSVGLAGAGAAGAPFSFGGGALPIFGKGVISERYVSSYDEAKNLPAPYIPKSADEVDYWADGDSISYRTEGGVALFAGAQYAGVGVGVPVYIKGEWGVYLQKLSKNHFLYSIHRIRMIHASALFGTVFAKVGPHVMAKVKKTYSFKLDLSHNEAREQFKKLMRGSLSQAQKLADDPDAGFIQNFKNIRYSDKGIGYRAILGFPIFIRRIWAMNNVDSKTHEYSFDDDKDARVYEHIYDKYNTFRHIRNFFKKENRHKKFKHSNRHRIATGQVRVQTETSREYKGEIGWSYTNDVADKKNLKGALKRLKRFTGLSDEIDLDWKGDKRLGFVGLFFKLSLDRESLKFLHTQLSSRSAHLLEEGNIIVDDYFKVKKDPAKLCSKKVFKSHCVQSYKRRTQQALGKVKKKLDRFFKNAHSSKTEARLIAKVARYISSTPFALQTVMGSSRRYFQASYRVNGEKFRPIDAKIMLAKP